MEGKKGLEKEAEHSRLVSGSFNKQEDLIMRLVLGGHMMSRSISILTLSGPLLREAFFTPVLAWTPTSHP